MLFRSITRARAVVRPAFAIGGGVALSLAAGCASPLAERSEEELRRSIIRSAERELAEAGGAPEQRTLTRESLANELEIRPEHLEEIDNDYNPQRYFLDGAAVGADNAVDQVSSLLSEDLYGRPQRVVALGLERAVHSAVRRNLALEEARLAPAISEAQAVAAEAAFDWVFFTNLNWTDLDEPSSGAGFLNLSSVTTSQQSVNSTTGLRKQLETGGSFSIQQELVYTDIRASAFGVLPSPNPASAVNYTVALDQPLLRGFGSDVALAQVRLARNAERTAISGLRQTLIETVTEAEQAYWELVRAHRQLVIAAKLLERGEAVRDDIKVRRILDAIQAQVADAIATVESRRGDVLRAQTALRRASDRLKLIINDPDLPVGSEVLLIPTDLAVDEPISYSLVDAIDSAIDNRPELDQAVLRIDDASIREVVADNNRLPSLDFRASATLHGFEDSFDEAYGNSFDNEFLDDFILGLFFEQPIGNRAGEAGFRQRRLERLRSVVGYRRTVQNVVLDVKNALDNVVTNYKLIEQAKTSRIAAAEALRTLGVEKRLTDRGFTVERLDLEFSQQDQLAAAERAEIAALIDYNTSIAELHRAMGTALERNRIEFVVPDANQLERGEWAVDYDVTPRQEAGPVTDPSMP